MLSFKVLRNNWKKTVFACGVSGYGLYYAKTSYDIKSHMKQLCAQVSAKGMSIEEPKTVLVVLNPAANKKKAEKMFKEYCEPVLNLAGYSVNIVKTGYIGHAKLLVNELNSLPDAIVVAGGDGTASEVVTGLLHRKESRCPIVMLPLGRKSDVALKYIDFRPKSKLENVKSLTASIMPLINENVRTESVMKLEMMNEDGDNSTSKLLTSIYGLNSFSWGLLRDMDKIKDKYWYFGPFRQYAAAVLNSYSKKLNWKLSTDFVCTPPCPGCRTCQPLESNESKSYMTKLLPRIYKVKDQNVPSAKLHIANEDCDRKVEGHLEGNQLNITCKRNEDAYYELETMTIDSLNRGFNFLKNVPDVVGSSVEPSTTLKSRTIQLIPTKDNKSDTFYSIDGEEYDVTPIKIEIIPNAIQVFCK